MRSQLRQVASSKVIREINRDLAMRTIQLHQPISRATLSRLSGLQPSSVSGIVGQLIEEGWVVEASIDPQPRGRWPTQLRLNNKHIAVSLDVRPGYTNLAVVDINGEILSRNSITFSQCSCPSAGDTQPVLARIAEVVEEFRTANRDCILHGVGVSVPGRVEQKTYRVLFSPNARWSQIDMYSELTSALASPILMDNAANACLFSERWFGNCDGASNLLVVSVSEGIGTGMLIDGRVARGSDDMAGEFGHMPFDESGPLCGCGNTGCWEVFASNRAALRYHRELSPQISPDSFQELLDLAVGGDILALQSIDKMASYLARGLAMLAAGLSPEIILIVGDCTALWDRIRSIIERELIITSIGTSVPRVIAARNGDIARLRGAAGLVFQKVLSIDDYLT